MASFWINTALMLPLSGLAAAVVLAYRTPELKEVHMTLQPKEVALHNLANNIVQTSLKQSAPMELTEGELNDYLNRRIIGEQKGFSSKFAKYERVVLDLEEGLCKVHFCWDVLGHRTVATVEFAITRTKDRFEIEIKQGSYGVLQVPRAMLPPLLPAMRELYRACQTEIDAVFKIPHITLAKDKVVLNPKF